MPPLPIFPERVLDGSIHTALLVGILVAWLATETLGWVFAGFVVSGYAAALALAHPLSLVATLVETILTYGVVWGAGIGAAHLGVWQRAFGRERFLLFLFASVPVRLFVDGVAAPYVAPLLWPLSNDPRWVGGEFVSIGLILVPLWANTFWKVGLARGLFHTGVTIGVTVLLLRFVLMPLTNFELGQFERTFDALALDFLATPKVTIVLLVTAALAAHNNHRYGWDFSGILVPALLAVALFTPEKAVVTLAEAIVLAWVYRGLLRLPGVGRLNLEGPRRLVSVYLLSYALKWLVASASERWFPELHVSDLFGFGYLLTSLIALKCVQRRDIPRVVLPIGATAAGGFAIATALSLGLTWLAPPGSAASAHTASASPAEPPGGSLERSVLLGHAAIRRSPLPLTEDTSAGDSSTARSERALDEWLGLEVTQAGDARSQLAEALKQAGFTVSTPTRADGTPCTHALVPRADATEPAGALLLWWCGGAGPTLLVPRPLSEPSALVAAARLMHRGDFSALVVSGLDGEPELPEDAQAAPRARDERRPLRAELLRVAKARPVVVVAEAPGATSTLDPRSGTGSAMMGPLHALLPSLTFRFEHDHGALEWLWRELGPDDALLSVSMSELRDARAERSLPPPLDARELLAAVERAAAQDGATPQAGRASSVAERLVFAEVLLRRILQGAEQADAEAPPPQVLGELAQALGAELRTARTEAGTTVWALVARDTAAALPAAEAGTWLVRPGAGVGSPLVGAPRPFSEPGTGAMALHLFDALGARALWLGADSRLDAEAASRLGALAASLPAGPLALREALRPRQGATAEPNALGELWLVRAQGEPTLPGAPLPEVLVEGPRTPLLASEEARVRALLGPALGAQPIAFASGDAAGVVPLAPGGFPVRYLEALTPGRAWRLSFSPKLLGGVAGTPARDAAVDGYRQLGVARLDEAEAATLGARVEGACERRDVARLLDLHERQGLAAPLRGLLARPDVRVATLESPLEVRLVAWGGDWLCAGLGRASAEPDPTSLPAPLAGAAARLPRSGCWELGP